ncbi:Ig-like domain-containing protein [Neobacillus sp. LXY-4]|uniref:Ig-like domain-containing protein n=1 Tax=Neobacillus sp. LXY-4 TaxID=3379826 RepID=UPI003EE2993B
MISRKKKSKVKKKMLLLFFPSALLLLFAILIFNSSAMSNSKIVNRYISFEQQQPWNVTVEPEFKGEWLTNKETVSFIVDLSEDVIRWNEMNPNTPLPTERPFGVTASYGTTTIDPTTIIYKEIMNDSGQFEGKYQVDIPFNQEGQLDINTTIKKNNPWKADELTAAFNITKDTTKPEIAISGISDGAYLKADGTLNVKISELHFDKSKITILQKELSSQKESPLELVWNDETQAGTHTFTNSGDYEITVNGIDKAGNASEEKKLRFTISKADPELIVTDKDRSVQINNGSFSASKNIQFKVSSKIAMEEATAKIFKEEKEISQGAMTINPDHPYEAILDKTFTEDGRYRIEVNVSDQHVNGEQHILTPFTFEIDSTKPTATITDSHGKPAQGIYGSDQNITIKVSDVNFDKEKTMLSGSRIDANGNSKDLKDLLVLDNSGEEILPANIEGEYTLEVTAADKAGNEAQKQTAKFTIDKSSPRISDNIDKQYYNGSVEFKLGIEDFSLNLTDSFIKVTRSYESTIQDLSPSITDLIRTMPSSLYSWARTFDLDGDYTIAVNAIDKSDTSTNQTKTIDFTIDTIRPDSFIKNVNNELYDASVKGVEIGVTDKNIDLNNTNLTVKKDGIKLNVDPLKVSGETASNIYNFEEDGVYSISLETTDLAGNKAETKTASFTVDTKLPKLEISTITDGEHYQELKEVVITAEDLTLHEATLEIKRDGEQVSFDYLKGNGKNANLNKVLQSTDFTVEGDYEIILIATDRNGKISEQRITFTIDHTAPGIEFSGINKGSFLKNGTLNVKINEHNFETNDVTITATRKVDRDKPEESYTIMEENKDWEKTGEETTWEQFFKEDGDYVIKVTARDKAQNESTEEWNFTIDNIQPDIKISNMDENGDFYKTDKEVTIKVTERNFEGNNVQIYATKKLEENDPPQPIYIGEWKNTAEVSSLSHLFTEDGEYELTVKAVDAAGNDVNNVKKVKFTVDKTLPVLTITGIENNQHYNVDKPVTMSVTERNMILTENNVTVTKDGKPYPVVGQLEKTGITAHRTFTFTEEGSYVVNLKLTDKAGNHQEHDPISFVIDKTNPVLNINGVEHQSYNPSAKSVTVSVDELNYATNNVELMATKDGRSLDIGEWKNTGKYSALQYGFNADGLYTVYIKATDKAGNGPIEAAKTFTIDTVKPAIEITGVENGEHYNVDKPVTATIKDVNLDVNKITVKKDGASYNAGGFSVTHHPYEDSVAKLTHNFNAEGDYEIIVEAIDKAGNSFSQQVRFTIDKTKPVITPKFKGENRIIKDGEFINKIFTPEFALDESEDMIVSVTLNGGANVKNNIPLASTEMEYHYTVLARDKAGNESTLEIRFTLDTTNPELNISGILDGFFNRDMIPKVTYSDKHLDPSRTSITLNGEPFVNGKKLDFEKDYVFKAVITDLANNVTTRTIIFTIDKTGPVIKFKEPISNRYFNKDLIPQLLIEDFTEYDIITQTLDGKPYKLGTPIKKEGKHVLYFEVKDKAGNIKQISVEFIIDKTAPKVVYEGVKKGEKYYNPVAVSISLDNPMDKIKSVTINGKVFDGEVSVEDGQQVIKTRLSDKKSYEIKVKATDEAGNITTSVLPFSIVEKSLVVKFYENKPLFMGSIAGVVGLIGVAASLALRKRRTDEVEVEE